MIQGGSSKPKGHVDFKSAFYFQTPVWVAEAPMFLKNAIKVTDNALNKVGRYPLTNEERQILINAGYDSADIKNINQEIELLKFNE